MSLYVHTHTHTHTHTNTGWYWPHGPPGPAGTGRRDFNCAQVYAHWGDGGMYTLREGERVCVCEREKRDLVYALKLGGCRYFVYVCVCVCVYVCNIYIYIYIHTYT
jgi:hypothetical protein